MLPPEALPHATSMSDRAMNLVAIRGSLGQRRPSESPRSKSSAARPNSPQTLTARPLRAISASNEHLRDAWPCTARPHGRTGASAWRAGVALVFRHAVRRSAEPDTRSSTGVRCLLLLGLLRSRPRGSLTGTRSTSCSASAAHEPHANSDSAVWGLVPRARMR